MGKMGKGDTADSWGLWSTVSSEDPFELKTDVFLTEILRAGGWLSQPKTYSIQGKWCAQGLKLLSALPGICLCILRDVVPPEEWLRQAEKRAPTENLCQCLKPILKSWGLSCALTRRLLAFFFTMRIMKYFCKPCPFAVLECKCKGLWTWAQRSFCTYRRVSERTS